MLRIQPEKDLQQSTGGSDEGTDIKLLVEDHSWLLEIPLRY
jgi:hypothetical protein